MNEPDQIQDSGGSSDLKQEVAQLRRLTNLLLLALVVLSFTFTAFLGIQSLRTGKDLQTTREQRTQVSDLLKRQKAEMEKFRNALAIYGQTHLDLAPILAKYGINGAPAAAPKK